MAVAFVQSRSAAGVGVSSLQLAYNSGNTAGNLLFVAVGCGAGTAINVSDTNGNTYGTEREQDFAGSNVRHGSTEAPNCAAGANTVTATFVNSNCSIAIAEYSGVAVSDPIRASSVPGVDFGTSITSDSVAAESGDLLVSSGVTSFAEAKTPGANYTEREDQSTSNKGVILQDDVTVTGAQDASFSWDSNDDAFIQLIAYKPVPARRWILGTH